MSAVIARRSASDASGGRLIVVAALVVVDLGRGVARAPIAAVAYERHHGALQVRLDRQRAWRLAAARRSAACCRPYWVFTALPVDLQRQAAGRLRLARLDLRAGPRPADRRVAAPAARHRSGRPQLRAVPHRHRARVADGAAADRARHAGAAARPAVARRSSSSTARSTTALTAESVRGRLPEPAAAVAVRAAADAASGLVDRLKLQTLDLRNRIAPILRDRLPRWGRGRVDTFNPYKAIQFNWRARSAAARRADRRGRLSVALEPGAARRHAPALGRQQRRRSTSAT